MSNIELANDGNHIGLIQQMPCGRIRQIGMTAEQQRLLQLAMAGISNTTQPFYQASEDFDLVLKSEVSK